jgi:hypothetical protein
MKKWLKKLQHSLGILTKHEDHHVGLFILNRQVSWVISSILIFGFLCFILGYFWGHRRALQRFVAKIEEESFADRISYALYTMNDRDSSEFEQEDGNETNGSEDINGSDDQEEILEIEESSTVEKQLPETDSSTKILTKSEQPKALFKEEKKQLETPVVQTSSQQENVMVFVAPLAGFGTLSAATEFIERIKILDPLATVQKRTSKTQKGRTVTWYQAVTGEYEKKEELQKIAGIIQKKEHIKKVEITEKRKG